MHACIQAIIRAWRAACLSKGAAKLLIPRGQFVAGEVVLAGPCTAKPLTIEIQGNLLAYDDLSSYTRGAWIMVEDVDGVVLAGGGTINGRGQAVWPYFSKGSPPLPVVSTSRSVAYIYRIGNYLFNFRFLICFRGTVPVSGPADGNKREDIQSEFCEQHGFSHKGDR